ncbi:MAG: replication-relaxation family protein [Terriglobales bacterium]|jgi:hypothetical protein
MAIDNKNGLVLQDRDRHLLRELAGLRIIDREQAKLIAGLGSTTRANARLLALTRAGLLKRYFLGTAGPGQKALYGISRKGAVIGNAPYRGLQRRADEPIIADLFVLHQLAVNDLYCSLKYVPIPLPGVTFQRWVHFFQPIVPEIRLIPDGYVEFATEGRPVAAFLEIDRGVETRKTWTEKTERYLQLARTGTFTRLFHKPGFDVLVIANSERRVRSIREAVAPLTTKLFWFSTFEAVRGPAFFGFVWLRPSGENRVSLIEPPRP